MKGHQFLIAKLVIFLGLAYSFVSCYDPMPLQDYCVAVNDINGVFVNGKFCKDPKNVTADDFFTSGLNMPLNTSNRLGSMFTDVDIRKVPGLNTLGVTFARTDYAPGGLIAPHIHPHSSEILVVLEGKIYAGFVSSNNDNNRFFSKVLYPGDAFVFPIGLIHFHANIGKTNAVTFSAGGSQYPGIFAVADTVFGSRPFIEPKLLAQAFAFDVDIVKYLQTVFRVEDDPDILNST